MIDTELRTVTMGAETFSYLPIEARKTLMRFQLMAAEWELEKIYAVAAGREPSMIVDAADIRDWVGDDTHDESLWSEKEDGWREFRGHLGLIHVDRKDIRENPEKYDYRVPMIGAMLALQDGTSGYFLLDGWHRATRAMMEGVARIPVVMLTTEEELACRSWRSVRPPPKSKLRKVVRK